MQDDSKFFGPSSTIAGRYQVIDRIAQGGMGRVVRVRDTLLDGEVLAVKLLAPDFANNAVFFQRFRNEVLLARRLSHPNIVRLFDFGEADHGYFFISMEYIDALSWREILRKDIPLEDRLPIVLKILLEVTIALDYAHKLGVIHRDVKPSNILLAKQGPIKLTDFGAARLVDVDKQLTRTGDLVGTPHYMAPEVLRGNKPDLRVDIYSLGILAFELITGQVPFDDSSILGVIAKHLNHPLPEFSSFKLDVPSWLQDFLEVCTEKDPNDRFQNCAEVAEVLWKKLVEMGESPVLEVVPSTLQPSSKAAKGISGIFKSFL